MKKAKDDIRINPIPKAVYESGVINQELRINNNDLNDITTDIQGNGYPAAQIENKEGE